MSENKITFPVKLASNNPQSFGIVDATEISGHRRVNTLSDLYAISDPILSILKDGSDAIGQEWFIVSENCKYRLDNWGNRKSVTGWTKLPKQELINTKQSASEKDQPNGYAGLDSNGKLPIEKTYGTTATVVNVATYESLPVTGLSGVIYYVSNTSAQYKWSGSAYIDITDGADNAKKNETSIFDCSNGTSTKYYTSLSAAINVVPPVYRTSNRIISYLSTENSTTSAVNYQYHGIDSTTWTNLTKWEHIPNQADLAEIRSDLNETRSELNLIYNGNILDLEIAEQQEVNYAITIGNSWQATSPGVTGKSYIIPVSHAWKKIKCKNNRNLGNYISFLKDMSNMTSEYGLVHFVDGDSGRIYVPANTEYEREIPPGTNYIVVPSLSSTGADIFMEDFKFYINDVVPFEGLYEITNGLYEITNDLYEIYNLGNVNISNLDKINSAIDYQGNWQIASPRIAGKSKVINVNGESKIILTCLYPNAISFLISLPNSYNGVPADFADGETRRSLSVGINILNIPSDANYIVFVCESSSGDDVEPSKIRLVNTFVSNVTELIQDEINPPLNELHNEAKQLVSLHGQEIENNTILLENMSNVIPISDPLSVLASGECNVYHEVSTGLVYMVCVEGFDHPYEAYDCCALYVFSLTNPNNVKRYQFAAKLDDTKKCYTANVLSIGYKRVRIFYTIQNENSNDGGYLYFRDFNFATESLTEPQKVRLTDESELTAAKILEYTINNGGVDTGKKFVYLQKFTEVDNSSYRYGIMNCGESTNYKPVVVRSNNDFLTCEFVTLTNFSIRYDCGIGLLGSKLYFVFRVAGDEYASTSGTALCTANISNDSIINWSTPVKFAEGDSRPDCYIYDNKVYMMAGNLHSVAGVPRRISSSVWEGTSSNPSDYTKVLVVSDTRGVQNPRVFRYGCGDYGILMQNSPARVDYPSMGGAQWQFKTAVCFVYSRIN